MKKRQEIIYHFDALFDPNGAGYTVTVPKLPGLVTEGSSLKEAREMARDAIRCHLEGILKERAAMRRQKSRFAVRERVAIAT